MLLDAIGAPSSAAGRARARAEMRALGALRVPDRREREVMALVVSGC